MSINNKERQRSINRSLTQSLSQKVTKTLPNEAHQSLSKKATKTISYEAQAQSHQVTKKIEDQQSTISFTKAAFNYEETRTLGSQSSATMQRNEKSRDDLRKSKPGGDANKTLDHDLRLNSLKPREEVLTSFDLSTAQQSVLSALKSVNAADLPSVKHDFKYTKLFLQKQGIHNLSIWSHLTDILNKIIAEQPENVIDYFEEYSRKVKVERLIMYDSLRDIYVPPAQLESAQNQLLLLNTFGMKEDAEEPEAVGEEEETKVEPPTKLDLEEVAFYLRQAGVAIPDIEVFTLNIAMKQLAEENKLVKPRFWGKLQGTKQDYFVIECELTDEEYEKRVEEEKQAEEAEAEAVRIAAEEAEAERLASEKAESERIAAEKAEADILAAELAEAGGPEESEAADSEQPLARGSKEEHLKPILKEKDNVEEESKDKNAEKKRQSDDTKVSFELPLDGEAAEGEAANGEEEKEDPLLPPLPPPKKLLTYKIPPILRPIINEPVKVPPEKIGEGVNRKVYFVTNTPELEWKELPKVTPDQINIARQIKVSLTGDLEYKIFTYPAFPGTEMNYMRAQIARISAATQVSPIGFYKLGEGGGGEEEEEEEEIPEEEEEAGDKTKFTENPKFQPVPIRELMDPSLSFWVHHGQHILKQGRTVWWGTKKPPAGEEEAEEEQEEEEDIDEGGEGEGEKKEQGPPLLTALSEDKTIEGSPAWSVRKTHNYNKEMAAAVIRSHLWPGACAFAIGKKWENVYMGWGHKLLPYGFSPAPLPHPEYEYDLGPEIMEIQDPTVEVEEAWRQAHKKKPPPAEGEEGEGEEGEEEEDEEEEDDD